MLQQDVTAELQARAERFVCNLPGWTITDPVEGVESDTVYMLMQTSNNGEFAYVSFHPNLRSLVAECLGTAEDDQWGFWAAVNLLTLNTVGLTLTVDAYDEDSGRSFGVSKELTSDQAFKGLI